MLSKAKSRLQSGRQILKSLFILFSVLFLATLATNSYFIDQVTVAGNTFQAGIWPTTPRVVINEVYYDVDGAHGIEGKNEWVELYNLETTAVNLKNWTISDAVGPAKTIHANISIPAGGFALISHDASTWVLWGIIPGSMTTIQLGQNIGSGLNNDADSVILKDSSNNLVDQMSYSSELEGHSWERNPKGTGSFIDNSSPTPGS